MTTLQLLQQAIRDTATDASRASLDPKNSQSVQQAFWFHAHLLNDLNRKIDKLLIENPTPTP